MSGYVEGIGKRCIHTEEQERYSQLAILLPLFPCILPSLALHSPSSVSYSSPFQRNIPDLQQQRQMKGRPTLATRSPPNPYTASTWYSTIRRHLLRGRSLVWGRWVLDDCSVAMRTTIHRMSFKIVEKRGR